LKAKDDGNGDKDVSAHHEATNTWLSKILHHNHRGMRGNIDCGKNDPISKAKFTMLAFVGATIMRHTFVVEQKINSHLIST